MAMLINMENNSRTSFVYQRLQPERCAVNMSRLTKRALSAIWSAPQRLSASSLPTKFETPGFSISWLNRLAFSWRSSEPASADSF